MHRVDLFDPSGRMVRRASVPEGVDFILNLRDGHYYDAANRTTFVQRTAGRREFLSVECPTCHASAGWACGRDHTFPIHRARIIAELKLGSAHPEESEHAP